MPSLLQEGLSYRFLRLPDADGRPGGLRLVRKSDSWAADLTDGDTLAIHEAIVSATGFIDAEGALDPDRVDSLATPFLGRLAAPGNVGRLPLGTCRIAETATGWSRPALRALEEIQFRAGRDYMLRPHAPWRWLNGNVTVVDHDPPDGERLYLTLAGGDQIVRLSGPRLETAVVLDAGAPMVAADIAATRSHLPEPLSALMASFQPPPAPDESAPILLTA